MVPGSDWQGGSCAVSHGINSLVLHASPHPLNAKIKTQGKGQF